MKGVEHSCYLEGQTLSSVLHLNRQRTPFNAILQLYWDISFKHFIPLSWHKTFSHARTFLLSLNCSTWLVWGFFLIKSLCKVFPFLISFSLKVVGFFLKVAWLSFFEGLLRFPFFKLPMKMTFLTSSNYKTQYLIASQTDGSQESVTGGG